MLSLFRTTGLIGTLALNFSHNYTAPTRSALLVWKYLKAQTIWKTDIPLIEPVTYDAHVSQGYYGFHSFTFPCTLIIKSLHSQEGESLGNTLAETQNTSPAPTSHYVSMSVHRLFSSRVSAFMPRKHISLPFIRREHDLHFKTCSFHDISWAFRLSGSLAKRKNLSYTS